MSDVHHIPEMDDFTIEQLKQQLSPKLPQRKSTPPKNPAQHPRGRPAPEILSVPDPAPRRAVHPFPAERPQLSAWVPASLSLFVWGGGQWVNGERALGTLFFLVQALVASVTYCLMNTWGSWVWLGEMFSVDAVTLKGVVFLLGLAGLGVGIGGVVQAYTQGRSSGSAFSGPAFIPGMASALIPGWGQLLNQHPAKATMFLAAWGVSMYVVTASLLHPDLWSQVDASRRSLAGFTLSTSALVAACLVGVTWVLGVYDAFVMSRKSISL